MRYIVVSTTQSRGRSGAVFKRLELARTADGEQKERPTQADSVLSIVCTDQQSPLWTKSVDDPVEID